MNLFLLNLTQLKAGNIMTFSKSFRILVNNVSPTPRKVLTVKDNRRGVTRLVTRGFKKGGVELTELTNVHERMPEIARFSRRILLKKYVLLLQWVVFSKLTISHCVVHFSTNFIQFLPKFGYNVFKVRI